MSTTLLSPSGSNTDLFKISKSSASKKKSSKDDKPETISRLLPPFEGVPPGTDGELPPTESKRKSFRTSRSRKWSNNKNQCGDGLDLMNTTYSASSNPEVGHYEALPLLKQRLGYFWEKRMFTDVVFKVGLEGKHVEAHRTILASGAEYFQKRLYSQETPLCDGKYTLHAKEFSVQAFEAFIKAFYTNEFSICLTLPVALEVFQATKKYQVGFLQDKILDHIRSSVTVSNVFEALQFSMTSLELTFIGPMCWKIIEYQTKEVLDYHLDSMDSTTLIRVLDRDQISLKETELYQYLVKWGSFQCKQQGIKVSGKTKRQFIEPLLKYIRFPTMTLADVESCLIPSRIMEGKEIQAIQASINGSDISKLKQFLPYKTTKRVLVELNEAGEVQEEEIKPSEPEPTPSTSVSIPISNKCTSDIIVTHGKMKKTRRVQSTTKASKSGHGKLNSSAH